MPTAASDDATAAARSPDTPPGAVAPGATNGPGAKDLPRAPQGAPSPAPARSVRAAPRRLRGETATVTQAAVMADTVKGAATVAGNQYNTYMSHAGSASVSASAPSAWEDDLVHVPHAHLPQPDRPLEGKVVMNWREQLCSSRLLLVKHAPARQAEAMSAMRSVLHAMTRHEPKRALYCSGEDGSLQLQVLQRSPSWREDRRHVVIYLYRNDPATLDFFTSIERVNALLDRLEKMDCHLVITAAASTGGALRDEAELARRVAVWAFDEVAATPPPDPSTALTEPFDLALALLAGVFPGLGLEEFVQLAGLLSPAPPPDRPARSPDAGAWQATPGAATPGGAAAPSVPVSAPPPPTRHQRWWKGERDLVLAELGIALLRPGGTGETGAAALDAGVYFESGAQRADVPAWLYRKAPVLLSESLEPLTAHYLSAGASKRFCVAYRRMLQALAASGVAAVTTGWLLHHFRSGLGGPDASTAVSRVAELLSGWVDSGEGTPLAGTFIGALAGLIVELERDVVQALASSGLLEEALLENLLSMDSKFWSELSGRELARPAIARAAVAQAATLDLLMTLATGFPEPVGRALADALPGTLALHTHWLRRVDVAVSRPPVDSLARVIFRDLQAYQLRFHPARWVTMVDALVRGVAPDSGPPVTGRLVTEAPQYGSPAPDPALPASSRWLLWDAVSMFTDTLDDLGRQRWPAPLFDAVLGDAHRTRFAEMLGICLRATAPSRPDSASEETPSMPLAPCVSLEWALRLCHALAMTVLQQAPGDATRHALVTAELLRPWQLGLTSVDRMKLVELGRAEVDEAMGWRDILVDQEDRAERSHQTQRLQAWHLVLRLLRSTPPRTRVKREPTQEDCFNEQAHPG